MTNEKARDFFSAYYEGNLEPGLCVSFEQKLKADVDLKGEYDSFVRAMDSLDALKFEEILVPEDLHERISARLDRHIYERKRTATPVWSTWLRGLAFAGAGALAIVGAIWTLNSRSSTPVDTAGSVPSLAKEQITYTVSPEGVTLKFEPTSAKTVIVTNGEGKEMKRSVVGDVKTPKLNTLLSNPLPSASVFGIQIVGETGIRYVAVPGKVRPSINNGDGTVVDLAKALSDFYRMPVTVETGMPTERASWTFTSSDAVSEASKAFGSNYSVTLLDKNGILEIARR